MQTQKTIHNEPSINFGIHKWDINTKRLRSLSQYVIKLDPINPPSVKRLHCDICDFSNMPNFVNQDSPRRVSQKLEKVHMDI